MSIRFITYEEAKYLYDLSGLTEEEMPFDNDSDFNYISSLKNRGLFVIDNESQEDIYLYLDERGCHDE